MTIAPCRRRAPAALALVVVLGGCGGTDATTRPSTTTATTKPATRPTAADPNALRLGQRHDTSEGNAVHVHAYQQPLPPKDLEPDPGKEFAAVEVEICAGPRSAPRATPESFALELPDGARQGRSFFGPKEPALAATRLAARACVRGWVNFEVPKGTRASHVVFEGSSSARWAVGGRAR